MSLSPYKPQAHSGDEGAYAIKASASDLINVLEICSWITNLFAFDVQPQHFTAIRSLGSLRRLAIDIPFSFRTDPEDYFADPLFRNITHLEVINFIRVSVDVFDAPVVTGLATIHHLTNFSMTQTYAPCYAPCLAPVRAWRVSCFYTGPAWRRRQCKRRGHWWGTPDLW
ncbi:hypothetical protein DFH07DRAFT_1056468 [Mycena maculata]|uniref:Uncharacterized protein n=1 Tax=Mycena maculata TaxID=230809 RepID=A0AAD7K3Z9_9AGAR|nr:hypothetical protein DFH07DRAFT_1056468 [Mycena maculata]